MLSCLLIALRNNAGTGGTFQGTMLPCAPSLPTNLSTPSLDTPLPTPYNYSGDAGVAELADAADLKSAGATLVGSSPTPGTTLIGG